MDHEYQDTSNPKHHAIAGALTGLVEYSAMYPLDFIKTRMQVLKPHPEAIYPNIRSGIKQIIKEEGISKFFRGLPAPFVFSVPAHALYYVTYEKMKRILSGTEGGYKNPIAQGVAGALAITNHNIVMNPADVIKQRMQVYSSAYKNSLQCFIHIIRTEGLKALYRSLPTQMAIDAPYGAIHFVTYELCQNISNPSRVFDAKSHLISGAIAGGVAAAATNPLDVCRTLLNTQERAVISAESKSNVIRGLAQAAFVVYNTHGLRGFLLGIRPRVIFHMPSVAFCWIIYEFFKRYFFTKDSKVSQYE